jgi:hypothetical protein
MVFRYMYFYIVDGEYITELNYEISRNIIIINQSSLLLLNTQKKQNVSRSMIFMFIGN